MKAFLSGIFLVIINFNISAESVDIKDAERTAVNFYYQNIYQNCDTKYNLYDIKITGSITEYDNSDPVYYIFNIDKGGFVIIAAENTAYPVLAYSYNGSYNVKNQNPAFNEWMGNYKEQIAYIRKIKASSTHEIDSLWNVYDTDNFSYIPSKDAKDIQPLLKTTWNQDYYYNEMCPADASGPGGHAYAGCVATAMAQVMNYYKFPNQGTGSHSYNSPYGVLSANFSTTTYDWTSMINDINSSNSAIAKLMYHCGISVNMVYGPDGSASSVAVALSALTSHFRYSTNIKYYVKSWYPGSWESMLKTNLDNKRPILYAGGVHAFVCDGYQNTNYFHFNWGWSGYYDGYFQLTALNPGSYDFTDEQEAVVSIYPNSEYPYYCSSTKTVTAFTGVFDDGSGPIFNYENYSDCKWLISPAGVSTITLYFDEFDTESDNDFVKVYDGSTTAAPLLGSYSGSNIPSDVTSTGGNMLVCFTTDANTVATGWSAYYTTTLPVYCSGTNTFSTSSDIISDGSGNNDYNNSTICHWQIAPPDANSITLSFTSFDTESNNDKVKIYDNVSGELLKEYSGSSIPSDVVCNSGQMHIIFITNSSVTGGGWEATYTSSTGINERDFIRELNIYPNPGDGKFNIECSTPEPVTIRIDIMNILGENVYSSSFAASNNKTCKAIDISYLSKGIYFIRMAYKQGIISKKLILN